MKLKILADESIDAALVKRLRIEGWDVSYITEIKSGSSDVDVLNYAYNNNLLLITEDKDFGELAYRLKYKHRGICLIRLSGLTRSDRIDIVAKTFTMHNEKMADRFSVLTEKSLRIKP